ncbi:MAG: hypothetical protein D3925_12285 [Candidatus Electrothrix sp. AR5]|nr:hypothetical protein [Candidatus Electrothrix sp. AR5]
MDAKLVSVIITASVTLAVIIIGFVYNLLRQRSEQLRYKHTLELEKRRAQLEESKLAIELYNQRQSKIFDLRLQHYPKLFEILMLLDKSALLKITPEKTKAVEQSLKECSYTVLSHCASTETLKFLAELRDFLLEFAEGIINAEQLRKKRIELLQSLHKDLGRTGFYIGEQPALIEDERAQQKAILQEKSDSRDSDV